MSNIVIKKDISTNLQDLFIIFQVLKRRVEGEGKTERSASLHGLFICMFIRDFFFVCHRV